MKLEASVIVPTYKRGKMFFRCLEFLGRQTFPKNKFEIIAIHDGINCEYNSKEINRLYSKLKNLKFFKVSHRGVASARNFGIKNSKGKYILTIDDDCRADKDWIANFIKYMENNKNFVAAGGTTKSVTPKTFIQKYISFKGA